MNRLDMNFYNTDSVTLAKALLGKLLVHETDEGQASGIIVETEAYMGETDAAAHTYKNRRTKRTEVMFGPGGFAYVYLIYGMYHCLNVTANKPDIPQAVLIRALEPVGGIGLMEQRRNTTKLKNLCSGPGKLCRALAVDMTLNGEDFSGDKLYIENSMESVSIQESKRINIGYSGEAQEYLWRFTVKDSPFVSQKP